MGSRLPSPRLFSPLHDLTPNECYSRNYVSSVPKTHPTIFCTRSLYSLVPQSSTSSLILGVVFSEGKLTTPKRKKKEKKSNPGILFDLQYYNHDDNTHRIICRYPLAHHPTCFEQYVYNLPRTYLSSLVMVSNLGLFIFDTHRPLYYHS